MAGISSFPPYWESQVLQVESDEIVAAVRNNNVPVDYILFDDEGHGFFKKENRIFLKNNPR